jgi:hypothetical protein
MSARCPARFRRCRAHPPFDRQGATGRDRGPIERRTSGLTERQVQAITTVMHLFVEDDLANGVLPSRVIRCQACRHIRPAPGFVRYDRRPVCNRCATDYEIRRAGGLVRSIDEYLTDEHARPGRS